jgi:cytochrome c5
MASGKFILVSGAFAVLVATGFAASTAFATDGKAVYNANCAVCHNTLSPKLGDLSEEDIRTAVESTW